MRCCGSFSIGKPSFYDTLFEAIALLILCVIAYTGSTVPLHFSIALFHHPSHSLSHSLSISFSISFSIPIAISIAISFSFTISFNLTLYLSFHFNLHTTNGAIIFNANAPKPFSKKICKHKCTHKMCWRMLLFRCDSIFCARYLNHKQINALVCHSGGALCACIFLYGYGALYYICCLFSLFAYAIL